MATPASDQKYTMPSFLVGVVPRANYVKWLKRKAATHCRRDRKRVDHPVLVEHYKQEIHKAVTLSEGRDWYTGEHLEWHRISTYNNEESKSGRSKYKAQFALLPTVDHVNADNGRYEFVICSWRTNDSKNDLSLEEFVELCRRVLAHHGANASPPSQK